MATEITNEMLSAQSRWDIATLINRIYPYPLDPTTLFLSLSSAEEYAKNSGNAYVGQVISVVENDKVSIYQIKNTDGDLQEFKIKDTSESDISTRLSVIEQTLTSIKTTFLELSVLTENSSISAVKENVNKIAGIFN
jgi:hypothetical protein